MSNSTSRNTGCTSNAQCIIAGTSCQTHGLLRLCIPDDKSRCNDLDALSVVAVRDVYHMFCQRQDVYSTPMNLLADTCDAFETSHAGICLLPECTSEQVRASSLECWLSELPTGAIARPKPDAGTSQPRTECTSSSQCAALTPGTSCIRHGSINVCAPNDRTTCKAIDPLFVTPVSGFWTMFCSQGASIPRTAYNQTCNAYESEHNGLCLLPECTSGQIAAGSKECFLAALPGSQLVEVTGSAGAAAAPPPSGLSGGAIAGIVIGVLALVAAIVAAVVLTRRRGRNTSTVPGGGTITSSTQVRLDEFERKMQEQAAQKEANSFA
ncbi:hypothetical protein DFJ74DRAFT_713180 [Hyaloraphidium curvatum]|nr:hypothetical protein DFJ74DRAFT_713180 [Hyaloraphidium curvatum]